MDNKLLNVEILIATTHRSSFDFLYEMFKHNDHADFKILIINQTTSKNILESEYDHIKVINSFEFGVPKSRNLAIRNATSEVCLMADDDIVYLPDFKQTIIDAYQSNPGVHMISFEAVNEVNQPYTNYCSRGKHNRKTLDKIYTWVISFKRAAYVEKSIFYNAHFGFGATFKGCEEYVFLRNAFDNDLVMIHVDKVIVMHPEESSGRLMGSDNSFFSKGAMKQRFIGNLSYIWLVKYVLFMWKDHYIKFGEIPRKFKIGLQGIKTYKSLKKSGEINKIYEH